MSTRMCHNLEVNLLYYILDLTSKIQFKAIGQLTEKDALGSNLYTQHCNNYTIYEANTLKAYRQDKLGSICIQNFKPVTLETLQVHNLGNGINLLRISQKIIIIVDCLLLILEFILSITQVKYSLDRVFK